MDITDFLPETLLLDSDDVGGVVQAKFLKLEMDRLGLDPTKGRIISIQTFKSGICRSGDGLFVLG